MIRYKVEREENTGMYMVEVFNGVESSGFLHTHWYEIDELRSDMGKLGVPPVYPPDVDR